MAKLSTRRKKPQRSASMHEQICTCRNPRTQRCCLKTTLRCVALSTQKRTETCTQTRTRARTHQGSWSQKDTDCHLGRTARTHTHMQETWLRQIPTSLGGQRESRKAHCTNNTCRDANTSKAHVRYVCSQQPKLGMAHACKAHVGYECSLAAWHTAKHGGDCYLYAHVFTTLHEHDTNIVCRHVCGAPPALHCPQRHCW